MSKQKISGFDSRFFVCQLFKVNQNCKGWSNFDQPFSFSLTVSV